LLQRTVGSSGSSVGCFRALDILAMPLLLAGKAVLSESICVAVIADLMSPA